MTETLSPTGRLQAELFAPVTAEAVGSKATMRIFGRIDPDGAPWGVSSSDVQAAIDSMDESVTDLEVQVQTRGGDAFEGVAIMNMIRALPQSTEAVVVGLAASAGSYIVQGADKVTMMPHSQLMIHRGSVLALGQAPDMRMAADRLESLDKTMANIYTEKAGGTADDWLAAMTPETWYTADEAVTAGLADGVRSMTKTPAGAKASLDLTPFAYAGREHAPAPYIPATHTPAEPPVTPPTTTKEADTMSDTLLQGLRERFGFAEDAAEADIFAKIDADNAAAEKTIEDLEAKATAKTKVEVPEGMSLVSEAKLDALTAQADLGARAHARQISDDRAALISAAMDTGKITRDDKTKAVWEREFARDFDTAKADLESLPARFPIGAAPGRAGSEADQVKAYTDDMAAEDAAFFGVPQEAIAR